MASSDLSAFIPLLFIAIFIAAVVLSFMSARKRRKMLAEWATSRNLLFTPEKNSCFEHVHPAFKCFKYGDSRYAFNIITGDWHGWDMTAFDYHYTTGSGKNRQTHLFSCIILKSPFPLKPLSIRPEGFFDKLTEFFGLDDIDFESAEFSRRFFVKAPEKKWAYDILHSRAMELLLNRQAAKYYIEFATDEVLIRRSESTWQPADIEQAVDTIIALLDMIPDYVKKQMQS